jgi:dihydrofolate synthase/folylpolyglutamate synthase
MVVHTAERLLDLPAPRLPGPHQIDNAGLAAVVALELGLPDDAIARGIEAATWPARMQRLTAGPYGRAATAAGAEL